MIFSNFRKYSEEDFIIFEDASILKKALNEKLKQFINISKSIGSMITTVKSPAWTVHAFAQPSPELFELLSISAAVSGSM